MTGWIRLSRKIFDCWLWAEEPFTKAQAWIDLLLLANYETRKVMLGNEIVEIERGSFVTSELKLMARWKWSKTKVRNFLCLLQSDNMIVKKTDHKKTVITIVKYGAYQDMETTKEPQKDREKTMKEPQKDTTNKYNNINNINNKERAVFKPPNVEEVRAYCQERGNNIDPESFVAFYESKGWMIGKNKMKSWKSAITTWEKRDIATPQKESKIHNFNERDYDYKALEEKYSRN